MSDDIKKFVDDIWKKEFDKFIVNDIVDRYIKNLQQELDQYKNNWEELKKWLDEIINDDRLSSPNASTLMYVLNKMKELEEVK